ncbi:MAG TPA: PspC domain-containing protein [Actinophytocola sp.]|uniref:PspC domain-containing protein n=1 Tax=Actinophytocola sp. TaxID=1872138 RepID=UPI002F94CEE2
MSGTQQTGMAGVEDTVKDFWATRPRRPRRGRKIAGVAAGIANRYRIDPTLVRVAFVVASLYGGAGIVLYLLGWLFLPEQDDEVSPFESLIGRGRSSTSNAFTIVLCLGLIPGISWFFGGFFPGFPGFLSVVVLGGALYLLHYHRGHLGRPHPYGPDTATTPMPEPTAAPTPATPMSTPPMSTRGSGTTMPLPEEQVDPLTNEPPPVAERREEPRDTPPAWDPLGAAPFAWDLPDPTPQPTDEDEEPPAPRRRKSRIGLLTVGVGLITAAVLSTVTGGWINPQHIVGIVLAVLGFGMVIGSFHRGGRGLIALAVPLAAVGIGMTTIFPNGVHGGVGDIRATPMSLSEVRPHYERGAGSVSLDLTKLPDSGDVHTRIHLGLGDVTVIVPPDADVDVRCDVGLGDVNCLGRQQSGTDNNLVTVEDNGTDGAGGLKVDLNVDVDTGSVEVQRG